MRVGTLLTALLLLMAVGRAPAQTSNRRDDQGKPPPRSGYPSRPGEQRPEPGQRPGTEPGERPDEDQGPNQMQPPRPPEEQPPGELEEPPYEYPRRPLFDETAPELEALLLEIEDEAKHIFPLFGQRLFFQALIDRQLHSVPIEQPSAPPPPSYQVAPGDELAITFWNAYVNAQTVDAVVTGEGTVAFDPIGAVSVGGLTVTELRELLTRLIRQRGPREATVRIAFTRLHAVRVSVGGEVRRGSPGVVLGPYATLVDALAAAGGPGPNASLRRVKVYRAGQEQVVDLYDYLLGRDPSVNVTVRDGDVVYVPVAETVVKVSGQIKRPARYELLDDRTLKTVTDLAGGVSGRAARVQVVRSNGLDRMRTTDLETAELLADGPAAQALEPLRDGDIVRLLDVGTVRDYIKTVGAFGLEAAFGYREGLTLGDLLTLAQGLSFEGHVAQGYINRARPDGQMERITFSVSELRSGGAAALVPLQPGDEVVVPKLEDRPPLTLLVTGAVNYPGPYTTSAAYSVAELIRQAGGLAPGAALQRASLVSTASGTPTETGIDLTQVPLGGNAEPSPMLHQGDKLHVPFLTEVGAAGQVRVEGFVRNPGSFDLTAGMRVSDLLERCGGRLPRASVQGKLTRVVPGTNETEGIYLDLTKAVAGNEADNPLLRDEDMLEVPNAAALMAPIEPTVSITGPVAKPSIYTRDVGMKVSNLIVEAGGLLPEADRDTAILTRMTDNGRVRRLLISPARAVAGDPDHDLDLANGDVLEVQSLQDIRASRAQVRISGAVYRPGDYQKSEDMTVEELLHLAGGTTPEAYPERAELLRRLDDGQHRLVPIDLTQRPQLFPLEDGDELKVYTHEQAVHREPSVTIQGDVQRPGDYERTEGMRLRDLLFVAGGPVHDPALMECEVARGRGIATTSLWPSLPRLMEGDESQNVELSDGDSVYVRTVGDYNERAKMVLVRGRVKQPGVYPISEEADTLGHLLRERVGGLLDDAFLEGAVLLRRIDSEFNPEAARQASVIFENARRKLRRQDYVLAGSRSGAATAQAMPSAERFLPTDMVRSTLAEQVPERRDMSQVDAAVQYLEDRTYQLNQASERAEEFQRQREEQQRALDPLADYVRVALDLRQVLDGERDLRLRPGDVLWVPDQPEVVLVQGEVASDLLLPFIEHQTVGQYIAQAGGLTRWADGKHVLVVRADGTVRATEDNTLVRRGDIILVPPAPLDIPREKRPYEDVQIVAQVLGGFATALIAVTNAFK